MHRLLCRRSAQAALLILLIAPLLNGPRPAPALGQVTGRPACPSPGFPLGTIRPLPQTARALLSHEAIVVLAVGSALQPAHVRPDESFPGRTLQRLREAAAGANIDLRVRNTPGATAAEMLPLLRRELRAGSAPTLLLWQTGTVDAAKRIAPAAFGAALQEGLRVAHDAGTDVVLVDPLYSRLLQDRADVVPYEEQFVRAAAAPGADLFHRHALTRQWVASGAIDIEAAAPVARSRTLIELQDCLARALARQIIAGATIGQQNAARN
jgi:hypothetical protein